jgi:hypothetical protein
LGELRTYGEHVYADGWRKVTGGRARKAVVTDGGHTAVTVARECLKMDVKAEKTVSHSSPAHLAFTLMQW